MASFRPGRLLFGFVAASSVMSSFGSLGAATFLAFAGFLLDAVAAVTVPIEAAGCAGRLLATSVPASVSRDHVRSTPAAMLLNRLVSVLPSFLAAALCRATNSLPPRVNRDLLVYSTLLKVIAFMWCSFSGCWVSGRCSTVIQSLPNVAEKVKWSVKLADERLVRGSILGQRRRKEHGQDEDGNHGLERVRDRQHRE